MPTPDTFVVAVIDDDPSVVRLLSTIVQRGGDHVLEAKTLAAGEQLLREYPWDIAIIDRKLPDGDGLDLCRIATRGVTDTHRYVTILSGMQDHEEVMRGFEAGADEYLGKPIDPAEFAARLRAIRRAVWTQKQLLLRLAHLEQLSVIDGLTQVYNRRFFDTEIRRLFDLSVRHQRALALLMLDLDLFKEVNDTHGHRVGDHVLIEISTIIAQEIRSSDVLARYGGEEFAIILPESALEAARSLAERLRIAVEQTLLNTPAGLLKLTVSVGVACIPSGTIDSPARLVEAADSALYTAKTEGRNRVAIDHGPHIVSTNVQPRAAAQ